MLGYLKRRFSSGDLQGEAADTREQEGLPAFLNPFNTNPGQQQQQQPTTYNSLSRNPQSTNTTAATIGHTRGSSDINYKPPRAAYPSAPTSPTRSTSSSFTSSAAPVVESITGQISSTLTRGIFGSAGTKTGATAKGKCKTILMIDEPHIDWSKYFRGRRVFGDWELRIEQATFGELSLVGYSEMGCTVDVQLDKTGTKSMRSFRPDFVVIRQPSTDSADDYKNIVMGLLYSGLPALNSLHAVFNMHERVWMFAHLELVRNRLGKDVFPLIEQAYYPSYKEMVVPTKFPMVIKIGNCRNGKGKVKVDNLHDYQDIASIVAVARTYATSEPFIDAKCDVVIQKIGSHLKAFQRKSISGSWKTNTGSAILEQVPMNDKFKLWITEVSKLFGGLDICSLKVLQSKTDDFFIYELKGSDMNLLGDSQEEDRKLISELIMSKIQIFCRPNIPKAESLHTMNTASPPLHQGPQPTTTTTTSTSGPSTNVPPPAISSTSQGPNIPSSLSNTPRGSAISTASLPGSAVTSTQPPLTTHPAAKPQPGLSNYSGPNPSATSIGQSNPTSSTMIGQSRQQQLHHQMMSGTGSSSLPASQISSSTPLPPQSSGPPNTGPPPSASSGASHAINSSSSIPNRPNIPPRQTSLKSNASMEDSDDTMKNLRKTFAGIFGDM